MLPRSVDGHKISRMKSKSTTRTRLPAPEQPAPVGEQATSLRLSILRELIDNEILMHRAEKLALLATDDEVDRKLNEIKSPYTAEQFAARLKEKNSRSTIQARHSPFVDHRQGDEQGSEFQDQRHRSGRYGLLQHSTNLSST